MTKLRPFLCLVIFSVRSIYGLTQVESGMNVLRAVIADNLLKSKVRIKNNGSRQFQIHDNATDESQP